MFHVTVILIHQKDVVKYIVFEEVVLSKSTALFFMEW